MPLKNVTRAVTFLASLVLSLSARADTPQEIASFVERHCLDCHNGKDAEAGFDLTSLEFQLNDADAHAAWVNTLDRVHRGEMPPEEYGRPAKDEVKSFVDALRPCLVEAERARYSRQGRSTVRRMSREEHIHALKDLLHLPGLTAGDKLPPDGLSDGFGKSSSALPFSHIQIDRYLEVADNAVRAAMAPQHKRPIARTSRVWVSEIKGETYRVQRGKEGQRTLVLARRSPYLHINLKQGGSMPLVDRKLDPTFENWRGNFAERNPGYTLDEPPYMDAIGVLGHVIREIGPDFKASHDGRYRLRVGAYTFRANHGEVEPTDRTEVIAFYSDTRLLGHVDVTNESKVHEIEFRLNAGEKVSVTAASLPLWRIEPRDKQTGQRYPVVDVPAIAFQGFEMEGPFVDSWPTKSHKRLFGDLPLKPLEPKDQSGLDYEVVSEDPEEDATRLLKSFIVDAYRREFRSADLEIPLQTFQRRQSEGASFQEAMLAAYASVLSSPHFVLVPMEAGPLPSHTLADRLALFLWNSPSDAALREKVARSGSGYRSRDDYRSGGKFNKFHYDQNLRNIVDEMISDPRVRRFINHFTDHWLDLRNIGTTEPDENLYNGYTPWLKESMLKETRAFVLAMLRENLPASSVIDCDIVFANGALAELYGIERVHGGDVQRVRLPNDSLRGGLLTQASVLKVSANGTTTSPVVRGVYVMDRLLGDPPPPPPEAVPAVEPDLSGATTIRELLAAHRQDAACASCHRKIDPPGFALESFDVMGAFRERYHSLEKGEPVKDINRRAKHIQFKLGLPVDSAGELAGKRFADVEEFRNLILNDQRAIARNLLDRLAIYATGAPIGISDRQEIEAILDKTAEDGYRIRSMIHGLIQSRLFLNK